MKWLRLYSEARTDAKLESLSDAQFRVWFRLLCFANDQPERGVIASFTPRLLAIEVARGDVQLLETTITLLQELRIIETSEGANRFINWQRRQFASDNVTQRVAAYRQRKGITGETLQKRSRNVGVTPPDTDTDTDTDTDRVVEKRKGNSLSSRAAANRHIAVTKPSQAAARADGVRGKPTNPIWDALASVTGIQPQTASERSRRGKAVKELREVGATAEEIARRADRYRMVFPSATLTDTALVAHWSECDPTRPIPFPKARTYARAAPEPPELDLHAPPLTWE